MSTTVLRCRWSFPSHPLRLLFFSRTKTTSAIPSPWGCSSSLGQRPPPLFLPPEAALLLSDKDHLGSSYRSYSLRLLFFSRTKTTSAVPTVPSLGGLYFIWLLLFVRFSLIVKLCSDVLLRRLIWLIGMMQERTRSIMLFASFCVLPTTERYLCWGCDLLGLRTWS